MDLGMLKVMAAIGHLMIASSYDTPKQIDPKQVYCVARAVYSEAKGEPMAGKVAVAYGVKNRTASKDFPANACDVIYQEKPTIQFPHIRNEPNYNSKEWDKSVEVALLVWIGFVDNPIGSRRFWYNPKIATNSSWAYDHKNKIRIFNHVFHDKS